MSETERATATTRIFTHSLLTVLFLAVRALALSPLFLPGLTTLLPLTKATAPLCRFLVSGALFVLLAWPERLYRLFKLKALYGANAERFTYFGAVSRGLFRLWRVLPALLPFLFVGGVCCYIFWIGDYKSLTILKQIGAVFGGKYDLGAALLVSLFLLLAALLAALWHRDWPLDFFTDKKSARALARHRRKELRSLSLGNFLLCLPACLLWGICLSIAALRDLTFDKGFMSLAMEAMGRLKTLLSNEVVVWLALIFILVYLPLWCLRKARAARLSAKWEARHEA